ncbi:hypothetical protein AB0K12_39850 [Nonomuraea sp. NPDC049419]|uniref:hypothetical protein n=1 Tax=Nonomuraea sp. NPDC049419 TaxID=3155772 RepID=UPI003432A161
MSEEIVAGWRARAMKMYPSDFAAAPGRVRITLLAGLCWTHKGGRVRPRQERRQRGGAAANIFYGKAAT